MSKSPTSTDPVIDKVNKQLPAFLMLIRANFKLVIEIKYRVEK